ncbi:MAG: hypothetical protein AAFP22_18285 [Planctomycetota bacterium]
MAASGIAGAALAHFGAETDRASDPARREAPPNASETTNELARVVPGPLPSRLAPASAPAAPRAELARARDDRGRVVVRLVPPAGLLPEARRALSGACVQVAWRSESGAADALVATGFDGALEAPLPRARAGDTVELLPADRLWSRQRPADARPGAPVVPSLLGATRRIDEGDDLVLEIDVRCEIWAVVRTVDETGAPVVNAYAEKPRSPGWSVQRYAGSTPGEALLRLSDPPPPPAALEVAAYEHERVSIPVPPVADRSRVVDLGTHVLARAPVVSGVVLRPDGRPAVDFLVERVRNRANWGLPKIGARTDADGRFRMRVAAHEDLVLWGHTRDAGDPLHFGPLELGASRDVPTIRLVEAPTLTLRFDPKSPFWVAKSWVTVEPADARAGAFGEDARLRAWGDGTLTIDGVRPGRWIVRAKKNRARGHEHPRGRAKSFEVTVELDDGGVVVDVPAVEGTGR